MTLGEELTLQAMKEYHKKLCKITDNAKKKVDENINASRELIDIHNEFAEIVNSGEVGDSALNKLDSLKKRKARANRILKTDIIDLMDKESDAELRLNALKREIGSMECRLLIRSSAARRI